MANKLIEVTLKILRERDGEEKSKKLEKDINDIVNFCSEKSINVLDIKNNKIKQKEVSFIYDYPKWIKDNNGDANIKNYNGGVDIYFYLSKEKKQRINEAMELHNYEDISEVHMKLIEVLRTQDLFYDIGYKANLSHETESLKDKAITSWAQES